jgi:hypothetical protein
MGASVSVPDLVDEATAIRLASGKFLPPGKTVPITIDPHFVKQVRDNFLHSRKLDFLTINDLPVIARLAAF